MNPTEIKYKNFLLLNTGIFGTYIAYSVIDSPYQGVFILLFAMYFWSTHCILLIIAGIIVSVRKNLKYGSKYFIALGLICLLGIIAYILATFVGNPDPSFFLLSS